MTDGYCYIPTTIVVVREGVTLFEAECEARCVYYLPDGPDGPVDWDVTELHFDNVGTEPGKCVSTVVSRALPLFDALYKCIDNDWIEARLRESLAQDGIINLYPAPARD
jgi:hypothetical protein